MDVDVRFARVKEARAVHRILMEAFGPYAGKVKPPFQVFQETPEGIAADMRRRRHRYAVALVEDVPVGTFRRVRPPAKRGPYWLVSRLAVLPVSRPHVAHRLIDWLHELAEWHQVPSCGAVRTVAPAHPLYQHFGYRPRYRSLPDIRKYLTVVARSSGKAYAAPAVAPSPSNFLQGPVSSSTNKAMFAVWSAGEDRTA